MNRYKAWCEELKQQVDAKILVFITLYTPQPSFADTFISNLLIKEEKKGYKSVIEGLYQVVHEASPSYLMV